MARWDPGTEERLIRAALELYLEHGYDNVTVTQIAERAGLTRRSYFRYFPDKREVLFAGSDRLPAAVRAAVLDADPAVPPLAAAFEALTQVGAALAEHVERTARRRTVIASSPELQERERTKFAVVTSAIQDALLERGVDDDRARLTAQIATVASQDALDRWSEGGGERDFATCLHAVAVSLREVLDEGIDTSRPT
ncbi:TetR/AcrR family transcriptional regulator [Tsukamurella tyrosinosolvens]|uniref:TetR/AcrR family transcriptional regulator n=1 Tax=Tsukamurella tyrosinosolvens TaxID=57704 RepID=UPI001AFAD4A3|nr:TetR/AcrR family transcriptional regulator [Tsukamurella tyrosinosolvens]MEC4614781.1 helix-turn-helix domain-containing protein [Tsukamurella tyrosinosolvens]QRY84828.1 TetR family transcriptional regulator [Tsukamurella tyrosinosolvens]